MTRNVEDRINKQDMIDDFETQVRAVASAGIQIETGDQPLRASVNFQRPGHAGGNWANAHTVSGGHPDSAFSVGVPDGPELTDFEPGVTASNIATVIRDHAYNLTRIRNTRLRIHGTSSAYYIYHGPYIINLSDAYRAKFTELDEAANDFQIASRYTVKASTFNNYMQRIQDVYNQVRTETFLLSHCHANCHAACHGSRNRR